MASTSGSDMNSSLGAGLAGIVAVLATCVLAASLRGADDGALPGFVAHSFGDAPSEAVLTVSDGLRDRMAEILGHAYPGGRIPYWSREGATAWILETRAKSGPVKAGFVVEGGRISTCEVLDYAHTRGREVQSPRFLRQFAGAALGKDRRLNRRIDAIAGATLASKAVTDLARLALVLDAEVQEAL